MEQKYDWGAGVRGCNHPGRVCVEHFIKERLFFFLSESKLYSSVKDTTFTEGETYETSERHLWNLSDHLVSLCTQKGCGHMRLLLTIQVHHCT